MSRIGKLPIMLPKGVEVTVSPDNTVTVKGALGQLSQKVAPTIVVNHEYDKLVLERTKEDKHTRSFHGLYRTLLANMVKGVSTGFEIRQELVGLGYRAHASEQLLELSLGYSHNIAFEIPPEVKVKTITEKGKNPLIILKSADKQLVGQIAAKIRSLRKPDPYKGKGVIFEGEIIRRKSGKTTVKQ